MPELPDVAVFKKYFDATSLHQEIAEVDVLDDEVLEGPSAEALEKELAGRSFESTRRHGKNLLVQLDTGGWVRFHFGMTGELKYYKRNGDAPRHTRVLIRFLNGYNLAYICMRKLGRVSLPESVEQFIEQEELGPDALDIGHDEFADMMRSRRGSLKTALMDQSFIAGIGNVYSDEILFQAKFDPGVKCSALDDKKIGKLYATMRDVLKTAITNQADPEKFPATYITRRRSEGESCPRCSGKIQKRTVSQRPTYVCPKCQKTL